MFSERLSRRDWHTLESAHHEQVDALVERFLQRRSAGRTDPVEDFLFVYYRHSPARLRRWHPGPGIVLQDPDPQRGQWRHYRTDIDGGRLDVPSYLRQRAGAVRFVRDLLAATAARPPFLGCLGLHEWAMVYRADAESIRHGGHPLRLGRQGTDLVFETHPVRCSHADAFRFFTPSAAPRNALQPTRDQQVDLEQPGCLHATMDLYKWAFKLAPAVPSELTLACFDLARQAREVDMRASPYDLRSLGHEPIRIETPAGKAEYVRCQQQLATSGNELRARLRSICTTLLGDDADLAESDVAAFATSPISATGPVPEPEPSVPGLKPGG